jgi:tight adherence protein B
MEILTAALVFIAIVGLAMGIARQWTTRRSLRARLQSADSTEETSLGILRRGSDGGEGWAAEVANFSPQAALENLIQQSGQAIVPTTVLWIMAGLAAVAALLGGFRTGSVLIGLLCAAFAASAPIAFLVLKRGQRLSLFERQLPDALDMVTRASRAGHALTSSIQLVADEMPAPLGPEFARVVNEARMGSDLNEALDKLCVRIPLRDVRFLATVVKIQRRSGGNLAEMLDRLADVVRERFKLLSQAHALAAQQRWSAIRIGISPVAFAVIFRLMNPHYFDPLLESPRATQLIGAGILFEIVGFFVIWRIAKLKV